jgi:polar amino acid transport system substrate-binding protein
MIRRIIVALLALLALPAAAQAGAVLDRVTKTKTLTMSTDPAYPPQSFQNKDGSFDGFDVAVGREIAKRMGVELKLVTPAWEVITAGNWGGRWDISVGSITVTEERAKVLDFPAIYYYTPAIFAVHKNNTKIKKVAELAGKRIGVCGGCTYEAYLNGNLKMTNAPEFAYQVKDAKTKAYDTDTNAFDDLKVGDGKRLDAVLSARPTIDEAIKGGYPMKLLGEPVFYEPLAVAVDKGDAQFSAKVKEIIEAMHKDGTLSKLSIKYYGYDISRPKGP